ncbi:hypothetical protein BOS5A_200401 [Bosea sp. EC-HK365B]|nr:hypothetical protein BOSE21B_110349 [Bosea sp. 21B]VVT58067.1 hypothetical protein BOS5A_200401 [Bosea sp. EC-HK365B]
MRDQAAQQLADQNGIAVAGGRQAVARRLAIGLRQLRHDETGASSRSRQLMAGRIEDARSAPERGTAARAAMIGEEGRQAVCHCGMTEIDLPAAWIVEATADGSERRGCRQQQQIGAAEGGEPGQCRVPGIGADQRGDAPTCRKFDRSEIAAAGVDAVLAQGAVTRQVELAMDREQPAVAEKALTVKEAALLAAFDEAGRNRDAVSRRGETVEQVGTLAEGQRRAVGSGEIVGQRQLGKEQQLCVLPTRPRDGVKMCGKVGGEIGRLAVDLSDRDLQRRHWILAGQPETQCASGLGGTIRPATAP